MVCFELQYLACMDSDWHLNFVIIRSRQAILESASASLTTYLQFHKLTINASELNPFLSEVDPTEGV